MITEWLEDQDWGSETIAKIYDKEIHNLIPGITAWFTDCPRNEYKNSHLKVRIEKNNKFTISSNNLILNDIDLRIENTDGISNGKIVMRMWKAKHEIGEVEIFRGCTIDTPPYLVFALDNGKMGTWDDLAMFYEEIHKISGYSKDVEEKMKKKDD